MSTNTPPCVGANCDAQIRYRRVHLGTVIVGAGTSWAAAHLQLHIRRDCIKVYGNCLGGYVCWPLVMLVASAVASLASSLPAVGSKGSPSYLLTSSGGWRGGGFLQGSCHEMRWNFLLSGCEQRYVFTPPCHASGRGIFCASCWCRGREDSFLSSAEATFTSLRTRREHGLRLG
jgi:hypothetical protein